MGQPAGSFPSGMGLGRLRTARERPSGSLQRRRQHPGGIQPDQANEGGTELARNRRRATLPHGAARKLERDAPARHRRGLGDEPADAAYPRCHYPDPARRGRQRHGRGGRRAEKRRPQSAHVAHPLRTARPDGRTCLRRPQGFHPRHAARRYAAFPDPHSPEHAVVRRTAHAVHAAAQNSTKAAMSSSSNSVPDSARWRCTTAGCR